MNINTERSTLETSLY